MQKCQIPHFFDPLWTNMFLGAIATLAEGDLRSKKFNEQKVLRIYFRVGLFYAQNLQCKIFRLPNSGGPLDMK